ncbi:hypothetical protein J2R78_009133 [Bradyrhizobium sp. USDA 4538]|uniref:hypothetical protein n=1 Tax=unclassified Bradyrhizobium TaxID=2631580 RepID=UPI0020A129BB|nr:MULTISPECIES: hypothetical protein [unclassified Bradyrhizobium]MCP1846099.1 hypothetical protein [Bradyrhizobium sp. USDA 4538]MCP1907267.1 hypothetical protein [Bradyrhizobium sp. USDA 4537]MCP1985742.1 hypothetical protein [Bradyrhizobium sp. USDA 4539]
MRQPESPLQPGSIIAAADVFAEGCHAARAASRESAVQSADRNARSQFTPVAIDVGADLDSPVKLRWWNIVQRSQRLTKTEDVKMSLLHTALNDLHQRSNPRLAESIAILKSALPHGSPHAKEATNAFDALQAQLTKLETCYEEFLKLRAYQQTHRTPDTRSLLFGKSLGPALVRGTMQSVIIVAGGVGLQYATVAAVSALLRRDPGLLPASVLERAATTAHGDVDLASVSQQQLQQIEHAVSTLPPRDILSLGTLSTNQLDDVAEKVAADLQKSSVETVTSTVVHQTPNVLSEANINEIIDGYVKPPSTYIDESEASVGVIFGLEAGVGFARGISNATADSFTESKIRAQQLNDAVNADLSTVPGRGKRVVTTTRHSAKSQGIGSAVSVGISGVTLAATYGANGAKAVMEEIGKALFFGATTCGVNVGVDALRTALPIDGWGDGRKQALKAALRVVGRIATQYVKAGITIGTASPGSVGGAALWNVSTLMVSAGQGTLKEAIGAVAQAATSKLLPADEVFAKETAETLKCAATLMNALRNPALEQELSDSDVPTHSTGSSQPGQQALREAINHLNGYLPQVKSAASLKADEPGIELKWRAFDAAVQDMIDGPSLEEVVITQPISNPRSIQSQGHDTSSEFELREVIVAQ